MDSQGTVNAHFIDISESLCMERLMGGVPSVGKNGKVDMKKLSAWTLLAASFLAFAVVAEDDDKKEGKEEKMSTYDMRLVKSRSKRFKDSDGRSDSGNVYIYADDKTIRDELAEIRKSGDRKSNINIGSAHLKAGSRVRNVNIVIDAKRKIAVKRTAGGRGKVTIGTAIIEKGAKVGSTKTVIVAKEGIEVEGGH